jgi:hypothetical protein
MYIEALLIRERILGPANENYHNSLLCRGAVLADEEQFHDTILLWLYEFELSQQYSMPMESEYLRQFLTVFNEIVTKCPSVPIEAFLKIATKIVEKIKLTIETTDDNLYNLLFLTTIISQVT